jgi:hypothetical protein
MVDWWVIGAGVGVGMAFAAFKAVSDKRAFRSSADRAPEWFPRYPSAPEDGNSMRKLGVGAILSENNGFPVNTADPCKPKAEMREWLQSSWQVGSREDAEAAILHLIEEGHSRIFDTIIAESRQTNADNVLERIEQQLAGRGFAAGELAEFVEHHAECRSKLEAWAYLSSRKDMDRGTRAYDLGRAVTVARVAYGAGYLSARDTWVFIDMAAEQSAREFASWREFAVSYMLGRAIWSGVEDPDLENMHKIAVQLQTHPRSPWVTEGWFPSAA